MFRSLRAYNYRVWMAGAFVSNLGGWMQSIAQDWVVLTQLTDHDATALGVTMALQTIPQLALVSVTGFASDRYQRRHILAVTQSSSMLLAVLSGMLILTGTMTLPILFVIAVATGVVGAFDAPARQAFVSDVVAADNTSNAVALNAASFNATRMLGPAIGGILVVAIGTGWVFIFNAATFLAMLTALAFLRAGELIPRPGRPHGGLAAGFRYVAGRPDLLVSFVMIFLFGAFGMNMPIFTSTMAIEFGQNASGFGILNSAVAVGSLVGALLSARRSRARLSVVVIGLAGFGVVSVISAAMPSFLLYAALLVVIGVFTATTLTTANGYAQATTDHHIRGRVMALYIALLIGSTPVGAPIIGWIATTWGPRAAVAVGGAAALLAAGLGVAFWLRTRAASRPSELDADREVVADITDVRSAPGPLD